MDFIFYKQHNGDKIWWVDDPGTRGPLLFSFDKKEVFNYWSDYPTRLSKEQKEIFDRENPFWAQFYLN